MNTVIADRVSGKFIKGRLDHDKWCIGREIEYWLGFQSKCYPMTPSRYATALRILKPVMGSLFGVGYILPDTIRLISRTVVVFHPSGAEIEEILYDVRLDAEGLVVGDTFYPVQWAENALTCKDTGFSTICVTFGALVRVGDRLKHVPLYTEAEYREYIRALATKSKDAKPWETILAKLFVYENFINQLIEEISKFGEMRLAEYVSSLSAQFRRILEATENVKAIASPQQREERR